MQGCNKPQVTLMSFMKMKYVYQARNISILCVFREGKPHISGFVSSVWNGAVSSSLQSAGNMHVSLVLKHEKHIRKCKV